MSGVTPPAEIFNGMAAIVIDRYLRLMELVSRGYGWDEACLLADAPVSLRCIFDTVALAAA
jgi:hypothetical protein